jgi:hypothetical protein
MALMACMNEIIEQGLQFGYTIFLALGGRGVVVRGGIFSHGCYQQP